MAEFRSTRSSNAGWGRRVYATPNDIASDVRSPEAVSKAWNGHRVNDEEVRCNNVRSKPWPESGAQGSENDGREQHADEVEDDNDVRMAAALLLEKAFNALSAQLCDACLVNLKRNLSSIASGNLKQLGAANGIGVDAHVLDEIQKEREPQIHQSEALNSTTTSNLMTADSNDHRASNIRSSAQRPIPDATAYMTGATSRETVTLQTKVTSESTDNRQRLSEIRRKKDFCFIDRINGKNVNILEGLELHRNVFNNVEQKELIDYVYQLQELGRNQKLRRRTYSEPRKWMRGKGRVTLQFGCCYNYAIDKDGNPPGIIREEEVDAIPQKFRMVIKRLVEWHVLPAGCIPDSCIVNIYDVGDCIPPHIDHHDFVRPFCTLSLLSECNIIFGTELKIAGPGEFIGSYSIPLPTGSVLILNGNGADVAKHAVPAVPTKRISITFRKMDPTKVPESFKPDKELLSTKPLANGGSSKLNLSTGSTGQIPDVGHLKLNAMSLNSANGTNAQGRISEKPQFSLENDFPALQISKTPSMPAVKGRLRSSRT